MRAITRLILTTDSSIAGAIQQAGLADLVIAIERRLVWGRLPSDAELDAFFAPRTTQPRGLHWLDDTPSWRLEESGAMDRGFIELLGRGGVQPFDVFPGHRKRNERGVYGYWEVGALLDGLARCEKPAVSGLDEGPFSLDMHNDPGRLDRYKASRLSLTEFGKAVLAGGREFSSPQFDRSLVGRHPPDQRTILAVGPRDPLVNRTCLTPGRSC
jgi:hypothetical protein